MFVGLAMLRRSDASQLDNTFVFCHNDGMATGVYKAVVEQNVEGRIKILGIDGMPGEGLEYVKLGHQIGTYYYPTHGEKIIRLALDILTKRPGFCCHARQCRSGHNRGFRVDEAG